MRAATTMNEIDFFGQEGGRLAAAFAAGCVAAFAFLSSIGGFIWKIIGKTRQDRIEELSKALTKEQERYAAMEDRLVRRIEQLETILIMETAGNIRQATQLSISEIRRDYQRERDGCGE